MTPRRRVKPRVLTDRETAQTMTANRRRIEPGQPLTIAGIRGRCIFRQYTRHDSGAEWVDVMTSRGASRTVHPDKITRVHRKTAA
jgi:hypothetical protein